MELPVKLQSVLCFAAIISVCLAAADEFENGKEEKPIIDNDLFSWYCSGACNKRAQDEADSGLSHQSGESVTVLMGGGGDVDAAYVWMMERSDAGDVLVLRASGDGAYDPYLLALAAENNLNISSVSTVVSHARGAAYDPFVVSLATNASMIWFAGGDQWKYYSQWKGSPLSEAIRYSPLHPKRPIGGTSAGCAIMPSTVYSAQFDTVVSSEAVANPYNRRITFGSDFLARPHLADTITDTHFAQRDRMGRLLAFTARMAQDVIVPLSPVMPPEGCNGARGIGVDEATALLIDERGVVSITSWRSDGSAYLVCVDSPPASCAPFQPLALELVPTIRLRGTAFELFDLSTWSVLTNSSSHVTAYSLSVQDKELSAEGNGGNVY